MHINLKLKRSFHKKAHYMKCVKEFFMPQLRKSHFRNNKNAKNIVITTYTLPILRENC